MHCFLVLNLGGRSHFTRKLLFVIYPQTKSNVIYNENTSPAYIGEQ